METVWSITHSFLKDVFKTMPFTIQPFDDQYEVTAQLHCTQDIIEANSNLQVPFEIAAHEKVYVNMHTINNQVKMKDVVEVYW